MARVDFVVCHRRDLSEPERLLDLASADGGEFRLAARAGQPDSDLEIRERSWIVLVGEDNGLTRFAWYRVDNVRDVLPAGTPDYDSTVFSVSTRGVSLFGRDWTIPPNETQTVVVSSVVAVYAKMHAMGE